MEISNFKDMYLAELQELASVEGRIRRVAAHGRSRFTLGAKGCIDGPSCLSAEGAACIHLAEPWREPDGACRPSHARPCR